MVGMYFCTKRPSQYRLINVLLPTALEPSDITLTRRARVPADRGAAGCAPAGGDGLGAGLDGAEDDARGVPSPPFLRSFSRARRSAFSTAPSWLMPKAERSSFNSLMERLPGSDGISTAPAGGRGGFGGAEGALPPPAAAELRRSCGGGLELVALLPRSPELSRLPPPRPSLERALMRFASYAARFLSSVSVSTAAPQSLNFSWSPPLSG
mmetsp:Transcript_11475/g.20287  ORF Transcript_11475/g.20287 Transcript_11475/m.20287 type:complete len:210 (+) Transcript_11475:509-1138(+)